MLEDPEWGCGTTEEAKHLRILHQGTMNYKFRNHCLMCLMCLKGLTYIYEVVSMKLFGGFHQAADAMRTQVFPYFGK